MSETSALIIAAGRGVRMGPRGTMVPKGLIEIGGQALVARSVSLLQQAGVARIVIVTGHLAEQYDAMFQGVDEVELVHNPLYADTGSLRSMVTGLARISGGVILVESDLIYEKRTLQPVMTGKTGIVISGETNATDEVYVWAQETQTPLPLFQSMSKDINALPATHIGELVGITGFSSMDTDVLRQASQEILRKTPKADYEEAVIHTSKTVPVPCHLISDLAWSEIDDEGMYEHASNRVWPLIQKNDQI